MQMGHGFSFDIDQHFGDASRPVLALGGTYPASHHVRAHSHARSQLFCPLSGIATASTTQGAWAIPAMRGFWIPAGIRHELRMQGVVGMQSLYFEPRALSNMPERCQVVAISPLMRALTQEAVALPVRYELGGRSELVMQLIRYEIAGLSELPLSLPLPKHKALAQLCRKFLAHPEAASDIDAWAGSLHISRRTFTRLFRNETGLSFVAWRQQACILSALPRLSAGTSVTETSLELGYENPASFTALFKRILGSPPRDYMTLTGPKLK